MKRITRKSKHCPNWCDRVGCYDEYKPITIDGRKVWGWGTNCKAMGVLHKKVLGSNL